MISSKRKENCYEAAAYQTGPGPAATISFLIGSLQSQLAIAIVILNKYLKEFQIYTDI